MAGAHIDIEERERSHSFSPRFFLHGVPLGQTGHPSTGEQATM
jgi:hypothetical protein